MTIVTSDDPLICLNCRPVAAGVDQGQRDRVGGRRRLLSRVERDRVGGQRGERPSLDSPPGPDDVAQHSRH